MKLKTNQEISSFARSLRFRAKELITTEKKTKKIQKLK